MGFLDRLLLPKAPINKQLKSSEDLQAYAKSVPDQVLKNYAGWTADSGVALRYIHLSGGM